MMDRWRRIAVLALSLALAAGTTGCADSAVGTTTGLTVFAAASLQDGVKAAIGAYEQARPGLEATTSFDASSALAAQIQQGAPADLFLSADTVNADRLVAAGLTDGPSVPFAGNRLVLIVPRDDPGHVASWTGLARPGLRVVAAGPAVPIQRYADALVASLAARPDAPAGFAAAVAANIVSREDNVRTVLTRIELGEGDAAIVYATDAATSDAVRTIPLPESAAPVVTYAAVVIGSGHTTAARAFLDWLRGTQGAAVMSRFGFLPPPPPS